MQLKFGLFLLLAASLIGCVPTKDLTYLQASESQSREGMIEVNRVEKPYRVQINDVLSIRIKTIDQELEQMFNPVKNADLNATGEERLYYEGFTINSQGKIKVPTLGEISVLGLTIKEIEELLEKQLLETQLKPESSLFVTVKLAGLRYVINGEVGSPGTKVIFKDKVTLMEAIASSGDITTVGDRKNVTIVRQYPQGVQVHTVDLTSIDAVKSPYYMVQPNDLILVNPLPQKSLGTGTTGLQTFTTLVSIISLFSTVLLLSTRL